jgi:hypothetical protein
MALHFSPSEKYGLNHEGGKRHYVCVFTSYLPDSRIASVAAAALDTTAGLQFTEWQNEN